MNVLVVCTGNICRSPVAAQVLAARLSAAGFDEVRVSSAGTNALAGEPMTREAAELSRSFGADPSGHAARQLTAETVLDADLVLTATRAHRAKVAELVPRAARRAYTLREFARVLDFLAADGALDEGAAPPDSIAARLDPAASTLDLAHPGITSRLQQATDAAARSRGLAPPPSDPNDDDILDPYRAPDAVYDEAGRLIDEAVDSIMSALATTSVSGGRGGS
ncbi:low molecular weight phosphatase family protein [Agromyces allii]|uniref:protein-tyrosine-phosphatase n=1 Tax=Agromyces allii TaxID=393607 RepID=A0ABP5CER5_9MICO|nr:low molecular weight phosphatase family protein [Agromyces allii]